VAQPFFLTNVFGGCLGSCRGGRRGSRRCRGGRRGSCCRRRGGCHRRRFTTVRAAEAAEELSQWSQLVGGSVKHCPPAWSVAGIIRRGSEVEDVLTAERPADLGLDNGKHGWNLRTEFGAQEAGDVAVLVLAHCVARGVLVKAQQLPGVMGAEVEAELLRVAGVHRLLGCRGNRCRGNRCGRCRGRRRRGRCSRGRRSTAIAVHAEEPPQWSRCLHLTHGRVA